MTAEHKHLRHGARALFRNGRRLGVDIATDSGSSGHKHLIGVADTPANRPR
jgi:hypothetical protein